MKEVKSLFLVFIAILIVSMASVFAYDLGLEPNVMGHSLDELETCGDGQIIQVSSGEWACSDMPSVLWTESGSDIYYDTGDVGIGTASLQSSTTLTVSGSNTLGVYASGSYYGVRGYGTTIGVSGFGDYGALGFGTTYGVMGEGYTGVRGNGDSVGVYGYGGEEFGSPGTGVFGFGWGSSGYDFYAAGPGANYGAASSVRWKDNVVEIDNALEKILALRGVYFDWDEEHGGEHDMGFIAEETGEVVPEIVQYEDRTNISNYYVEDGERKLYASGVDYGALTPMLVEAIKDQQTQINELKTRVDTLEN